MNEFPIIPATTQSINQRKLIYGVGINDAEYLVKPLVDGERLHCPYYRVWIRIIERCNDDRCKERHPTYKDCFVCDEWLIFSNFREWMIEQDWQGNHIDKDILEPGNKEYHPDKCLFVSQAVNSLLTDSAATRGDLPIGCYRHEKRYRSQVSVTGKNKHLGLFDTPEQAHEAYKKAKYAEVVRVAFMQEDSRISEGLLKHAANILKGVSYE